MIAALAGCTTYGDYRTKPADVEVHIAENYQAVYARLLSSMRVCVNPGAQISPFSTAATALTADLYPDLGYGEIANGLSGLIPDTMAVTRVSKSGSGAVVSIKTGNMIPAAASSTQQWIIYWAKGGTSCSQGINTAPPAI